jgi:hypothetical protein
MSLENEQTPAPAAVTEQPTAPQQVAPEAIEPEDPDDAPDEPEGSDEALGEDGKPRRQPSRSQRYREQIARRDNEIADLKAKISAQPAQQPKVRSIEERIGPPPDWNRFGGNQAAYYAAYGVWEGRKAGAEHQMHQEQAETQARETARQEALAASYAEKRTMARDEMPDFDQVIAGASAIRLNDNLALLIVESDQTAKLEYHLAKNPQKLRDLNRMSPTEAARAIGRLEAQLSPSAQNRSTQAPAPLAPIRGGAAGPAKSLADMDMDAYVAARKAGRKA